MRMSITNKTTPRKNMMGVRMAQRRDLNMNENFKIILIALLILMSIFHVIHIHDIILHEERIEKIEYKLNR